MKKNKLVNLFKMAILFFGMSILLLNCEKENLVEQQEVSIENKFEKQFNKEDFKKKIPFDYDVDWNSAVKEYSKELETNFYEFELIYNTPFNPTAVNKTKKEGFNTFYKLVVTENEENNLTFFIAKFFQEKEKSIVIEDLDISLNKNTGYKGLTHLYNSENELHFAKHVNKEENKKSKLYFKDKSKIQDSNILAKGDITNCKTSTLYHYIDWYRYSYDAWGNLISVVFLNTEYIGSSSSTSCVTEFQPDEPIRIIRGEGDGYLDCNDGSGRRNCAREATPIIMCQIGFKPDENGNCVEVKKLTLDDLDDGFTFSDTLGLTNEQENWINDIRNKEAKDAITNYLNSFAFTPEFENAKVFAYQSILALFGNSLLSLNSINFDKEIIISSSVPNCVKTIINKLAQDNAYLDLGDMPDFVREEFNLSGHIMDVFNNSSKYHLNFKVGSLQPNNLGQEKNAETKFNLSTKAFDITLNSSYVSNATDLSIARTVIHESLHAYISLIYHTQVFSDLRKSLDRLLSQNGNNPNTAEHKLMVKNFISSIANSLESWNNYSLTDNNYYTYLSWSGGMINTPAFNALSTDFKQSIIDANQNEGQVGSGNSANNNALGTKNCN
ncbi:hypothetical protein [Polaribacter sp. ALD11]|uniref:hypothetical protein n=1 Tax=Polaribacter sp. ALD11 TaxID=2058137 RepID=UPI0012FD4AC7|nr:hypothetical protein [Polaribacter sp. ALD11]